MYKYSAVLILALLVATEGHDFVAQSQFHSQARNAVTRNWEGLGLTADINAYVDSMIDTLVPFMIKHDLDPLSIPDIEETFEVRPVLITYRASLGLTNGKMSGLVNVARSGDQLVHYFAKMLRAQAKFKFTDLEFDFDYRVKVMNIGPTGRIRGSLSQFVINVDLIIDFNNDEIHLQELYLTDVGVIRVSLSGNILYDWLVTPLANVFVRLFDNVIMGFVETTVKSIAGSAIADVNVNLKQVIRDLEALNN
ncbi:uncharacterized protein LOC101746909 [Bombyx mori]|uniref:Hemolymph juvenile hormone binding protein n=1 Tax=Bombyx mori TaxID=7091 RepID=A0A8R2ANM6_BOMMO|nr:uncharacterized protein LOC101746909 [Bombyx mori]